MNILKNILLLFLVVIFLNSCMGATMPVANYVKSAKNGETVASFNAGVPLNAKGEFGNEESLAMASSISLWKKIDDDTSYEFYILGARRIENLYRNGLFYFDAFASLYLYLPLIGGNLGFTTGLKFKNLDIYTSLRGDGLAFLFLFTDEEKGSKIGVYRHIKPAVGLVFKLDKFSLSLEGSIIKYSKLYNSRDNEFFGKTYFINLGISYKL